MLLAVDVTHVHLKMDMVILAIVRITRIDKPRKARVSSGYFRFQFEPQYSQTIWCLSSLEPGLADVNIVVRSRLLGQSFLKKGKKQKKSKHSRANFH